MSKIKYKVKKEVCEGDHFIEHYFPCNPENFVGRFKKIGNFNEANGAVDEIICESCKQDAASGRYSGIEIQVNVDGNTETKRMKHSYQVKDMTRKFDHWELYFGKCHSEVKCWTPYERLFEVRRKGFQFMILCYKIRHFPHEECVFKSYVNLKQYSDGSHGNYEGITVVRDAPQFFWPGLLRGLSENDKNAVYYMYIHAYPKENLESSFPNPELPIQLMPVHMRNRYVYPLTWFCQFYKPTPGMQYPNNRHDLRRYHKLVAVTVLEMYKGGSVMKVSQYKYVENNTSVPVSQFTQDHNWVDNNDHLVYSEAFQPGIQSGLAGPVVSFYGRVDTFNRKF